MCMSTSASWGSRTLRSIAQALFAARIVVVPDSTTTEAVTVPAVLRNSRRFRIRFVTLALRLPEKLRSPT